MANNPYRKEDLPYIKSFRHKMKKTAEHMKEHRENLLISCNAPYVCDMDKKDIRAIASGLVDMEYRLREIASRAGVVIELLKNRA